MVSKPFITIFDLDGVLIDNVNFERTVTDCLVSELARKRNVSEDVARSLWKEQLNNSIGHSRWFDYAFHCESLGLGEAHREAHWASGHTLNVCEGIEAVVDVARKFGECWIATDASGWVTAFKLQTLRVPSHLFAEVFNSTNCQAHKGMTDYWQKVNGMLKARNARAILIDNRSDRLESACSIIKGLKCILVDAEDHTIANEDRLTGKFKALPRRQLAEKLERLMKR